MEEKLEPDTAILLLREMLALWDHCEPFEILRMFGVMERTRKFLEGR